MRTWMIAATISVLAMAGAARGVEVSGEVKDPDKNYPKGSDFKLTGDTVFKGNCQMGNLDVGGYKLTVHSRGVTVNGVISGAGSIVWDQSWNSVLKGDKPNTFSGPFALNAGRITLAKAAGVDAIAGDFELNESIVVFGASNQIKDGVKVTLAGKKGESKIQLQGCQDRVGPLDLQCHSYIELDKNKPGPGSIAFADSSAVKWAPAATLTIVGWAEGKGRVSFGANDKGLTAAQLAKVGFLDPAGKPAGTYHAKITSAGILVPGEKVAPVNPPFDMSQKACAERAKLYEAPGLAELAGKGTPLKKDMRIDFFGDSITWQNVYVSNISKSLKAGEGAKDLDVKLFNHGVNGGGVLTLRDGGKGNAHFGGTQPKPFAETIAADKADVAVIYIGVNDVWWRKTAPGVFEKALTDMINQAKANKTVPVLATLAEWGETATSPKPKCDEFAEITRKVAAATGTTLVDLRKAFMAALANDGSQVRPDGSVKCVGRVLTYDGVHPNARGNEVLANLIARGIYEALKR